MVEGLIALVYCGGRSAFCSVFRVSEDFLGGGDFSLAEGRALQEWLTKGKAGSFGGLSGEGTPGPIPNPAVKLSSADGTSLVAGRKSRSSPKEPVSEKKLLGYLTWHTRCAILNSAR